MSVSIQQDKVREVLLTAIINKLQEKAGVLDHRNNDGMYEPARWWYNQYDPSQGGKILNTSGSMSVSNNNSNIQVDISLEYTLQERTQ